MNDEKSMGKDISNMSNLSAILNLSELNYSFWRKNECKDIQKQNRDGERKNDVELKDRKRIEIINGDRMQKRNENRSDRMDEKRGLRI